MMSDEKKNWNFDLKIEGERKGEKEKPVLFLFQSSLPNTLVHLNKGRAMQFDDSVRGVVNKWRHTYILIFLTFSLIFVFKSSAL